MDFKIGKIIRFHRILQEILPLIKTNEDESHNLSKLNLDLQLHGVFPEYLWSMIKRHATDIMIDQLESCISSKNKNMRNNSIEDLE